MSFSLPEQLASEWRDLLCTSSPDVLQLVRNCAEANQEVLANHFYDQLLSNPAASTLISHDQVKTRLHRSMMRWVAATFSVAPADNLSPLVAQQMHIGEVHARIDVPMYLVLSGARNLKRKFFDLLCADDLQVSHTQLQAIGLVSAVIDLTMEIMGIAFSGSHDRNSRAEEAYRLFSVVQNVAAERERQRAALLDWENQLMFELAMGQHSEQLPRIGAAEFGLWYNHKGAHAFESMSESALILKAMEYIDNVLLPLFEQPEALDREESNRRLRELREQTKVIGFHLDNLFQQNHELEAGRDVLTRLLNRKFLPVVLSKEVAYARQRGTTFSLLAIDIDYFKKVNDQFGHEAGDAVLQQVAIVLSNYSRGGDYIFRLGGEEFLMLLVDTDEAGAIAAAEKLRGRIADEIFRLPMDRTINLTISIGLAVHNGHPDYQLTLRRADEALYRAKHGGRNCLVVAPISNS